MSGTASVLVAGDWMVISDAKFDPANKVTLDDSGNLVFTNLKVNTFLIDKVGNDQHIRSLCQRISEECLQAIGEELGDEVVQTVLDNRKPVDTTPRNLLEILKDMNGFGEVNGETDAPAQTAPQGGDAGQAVGKDISLMITGGAGDSKVMIGGNTQIDTLTTVSGTTCIAESAKVGKAVYYGGKVDGNYSGIEIAIQGGTGYPISSWNDGSSGGTGMATFTNPNQKHSDGPSVVSIQVESQPEEDAGPEPGPEPGGEPGGE